MVVPRHQGQQLPARTHRHFTSVESQGFFATPLDL